MAIGAVAPLKPTKQTAMILHNLKNKISKPIPNKSLVMFDLFNCSRY